MDHEKFKSNMAVIVAFVTVLGALAACLASVAVSAAGELDFNGLDASIRAQKAEIVNQIRAYDHSRSYTSYYRYDQLGYILYDEVQESPDAALEAQRQEAWGISGGLIGYFFNPRFIRADGNYDVVRELQEEWADDSQNEDLNSAPYFEESDHQRRRSSFLTADMIVIALSFWFLTIAQATEKKIKYLWATIGIFLALAGMLGIAIGRFMI